MVLRSCRWRAAVRVVRRARHTRPVTPHRRRPGRRWPCRAHDRGAPWVERRNAGNWRATVSSASGRRGDGVPGRPGRMAGDCRAPERRRRRTGPGRAARTASRRAGCRSPTGRGRRGRATDPAAPAPALRRRAGGTGPARDVAAVRAVNSGMGRSLTCPSCRGSVARISGRWTGPSTSSPRRRRRLCLVVRGSGSGHGDRRRRERRDQRRRRRDRFTLVLGSGRGESAEPGATGDAFRGIPVSTSS